MRSRGGRQGVHATPVSRTDRARGAGGTAASRSAGEARARSAQGRARAPTPAAGPKRQRGEAATPERLRPCGRGGAGRCRRKAVTRERDGAAAVRPPADEVEGQILGSAVGGRRGGHRVGVACRVGWPGRPPGGQEARRAAAAPDGGGKRPQPRRGRGAAVSPTVARKGRRSGLEADAWTRPITRMTAARGRGGAGRRADARQSDGSGKAARPPLGRGRGVGGAAPTSATEPR